MSAARITFVGGKPKLTYRDPVIYTAEARMLVTQSGFPWGRVILPGSGTSGATTAGSAPSSNSGNYADPSRFSQLAAFYAALVNGDQIQQQVVHPKLHQALTAQAEVDSQIDQTLPIVDFNSLAPSPQGAIAVATSGLNELRAFVSQQQADAGIPAGQRVLLETLQQPNKAKVAVPHKKTVPIVAFMTVMLATLGLVLALENLRPRARLKEVALAPAGAAGSAPPRHTADSRHGAPARPQSRAAKTTP
jgi:hypothetical protein